MVIPRRVSSSLALSRREIEIFQELSISKVEKGILSLNDDKAFLPRLRSGLSFLHGIIQIWKIQEILLMSLRG